MAVVEGFRTVSYASTFTGFFILEVPVGCLCLKIECLFTNWETIVHLLFHSSVGYVGDN